MALLDAHDGIGRTLASLDATAVALGQGSGLFELLERGAADLATIRAQLGLGPRGANALLTALVALKLLARRRRRFALTARGRQRARVAGRYACNRADVGLAYLLASLRQDLPLQPERIDAWAAGQALPDAAAAAQRMHALMAGPAETLAQQQLFGRFERVLDVAGGLGTLCAALLGRWPGLRCGLFDLPAVVDVAAVELARRGLQPLVRPHRGDMFRDRLPRGYDAHLWSNVFHDWPAASCLRLARKSLAALAPGGRILLHEQLLDDDRRGPAAAALFSLMMHFTTRGQQFCGAELRALLREAGFVRPRVVRCGDYSLVTAIRP